MLIFIIGGIFVLAAMAAILWPMFSASQQTAPKDDRESQLYMDQIGEVDRDLARGVLSEDQAKSARTEIERRLLGALRRQETSVLSSSRGARMITIAFVATLPLVAGGLYLHLGSPTLPDQPFAKRKVGEPALAQAAGTHSEMRERIAALEARLQDAPDDVEGQALLARSYASVGEYQRALNAYRRANELAGGSDRRLAGEMAEVLVLANDGLVPDDAFQIFQMINADFPDDPQAAYYLALGKAQSGNTADALAELVALRDRSPAGAPWLGTVTALIAEIDPSANVTPGLPPARGPNADQVAAAAQMSDADRAAMINGMVEGLAARLEANPDDVDGWRRLGRAYAVLGDNENAAAAYREVLARDPNDAAAKAFLAQ